MAIPTCTGSSLRPRPVAFKAAIAEKLTTRVWPLIESGAIQPAVAATFPLAQVKEAQTMFVDKGFVGKIVLDLAAG